MIRYLIIIFSFSLGFNGLIAQDKNPKPSTPLHLPGAKLSATPSQGTATEGISFSPRNYLKNRTPWKIRLEQRKKRSITHGAPPTALSKEADVLANKRAFKGSKGQVETISAKSMAPMLVNDFPGNTFNNWTPPDNGIAVSDAGRIVSVTNSSIRIMEPNGNLLLEDDFSDYLSFMNLSGGYFDPRVIYDPATDRFIVVVLNGNTPQDTRVVIGFSTTSDPMDNWWYYAFNGNPDGSNTWFDFPSIGISESDLYVSGNLFDPNGAFQKNVIFQIEKVPGINGFIGNEDWLYFNNVQDANGALDFTVAPISYGFDGSLSPGIFFASTDVGGGNTIMLYYTTADINNNPNLEVSSINVEEYRSTFNGFMSGTNDLLSTNDCRIMSGYWANGTMHLVLNSADELGWTRVYYSRINTSTLSATSQTFGLEGFEYAFPAIAPIGNQSEDINSIIAFLRTSADLFPQFRYVATDETGEFGNSVLIKDGEGFVNFSNGELERWGDYTGICRQHGATNPTIYAAGGYAVNSGNISNVLGTWIAQIQEEASSVVAPQANFTANQTTINEGQSVSFTDLSSNTPTSWTWSFPGGTPNSSTQQNPNITYNVAGTYAVTLSATNAGGTDTREVNAYITVNSNVIAPQTDFTANQTTINEGQSVTFTDISVNNPTSWTWSFPGGTPNSSTQQNPTVNYTTAGTYPVTLISTNTAGSDTEQKNGYITVNATIIAPQADFMASQTTINEGQSVVFTDLSANAPTIWSWSFPGGTPNSSTEQNPTISYSTAGTYPVTLISTNAAGSDTEQKSGYITVNATLIAPQADFTASQTTINEGQSIVFTDLSANTPTIWSWSFPGGTPNSSTEQNPTISYSTAGTYPVTLISTNAAGSDTEQKSGYITVNATVIAPQADFTANQTTINEGQSVMFTDLSINEPTVWSWSFPGGTPNSSTQQNPTITYSSAGVYAVTLISTNAAGTDSEQKNAYITVSPTGSAPVANFMADETTVLSGSAITFSDLSTNEPVSWNWSFPGGIPESSTLQNPIVIYPNEGTFDVTLEAVNAFGTSTENKTTYITVNPIVLAPQADFTADMTNLIAEEAVSFTDLSTNTPTSWNWSFPGGTPNSSTMQNPVINYNTPGTYTVTLIASNSAGNDSETKNAYITVEAAVIAPQADFTANNTEISVQESILFTDLSTNEPSSWTWSFPGGTPNSSTLQNPVVTYNNSGTYPVTLIASNSAGNDSETKNAYITVNDLIQAPQADFTADNTMILPEEAVNFTDLSSNTPTTWNWSFPGGSPATSTVQNPTVVYNTPGTYAVTLIASNSAGNDSETKTNYITVSTAIQAPEADFTADNTAITVENMVQFTDLSTNEPNMWNWSFPGGTPATSTAQNPSITYNTPGTYTVSLVAANSAGNDSETKSAYITVDAAIVAPEADFTADDTNITEDETISFTDLSTNAPSQWTWAFPGGIPATSTEQNPTVSYATAGTYTVTLVVSNSAGNDTETKEEYITVAPKLAIPEANFTANLTSIDPGGTVSFSDQSSNEPTNWAWSFPGGVPNTSTTQNPIIIYPEMGIYDVSLIVGNDAGNNALTREEYIAVGLTNTDALNQIFQEATLFPNPVGRSMLYFNFTLAEKTIVDFFIIGENGQILKHLLSKNIRAGENELSFSCTNLAAGTYFLVAQNQDKTKLYHEKFIVQ